MSGSVPTTPTTFIERARADYAECARIVNSAWYIKKSRLAMVRLLEVAITKAVREGDDRFLHVTYTDINSLMQGWWGEDVLKERIAATVRALNLGQLQRQSPPAPVAPISTPIVPPLSELGQAYLALKESEKLVKKCNKALETANERLQKALDATEAKLATAEAALVTAQAEITQLKREKADLEARLQLPREAYGARFTQDAGAGFTYNANRTQECGEEVHNQKEPHAYEPLFARPSSVQSRGSARCQVQPHPPSGPRPARAVA